MKTIAASALLMAVCGLFVSTVAHATPGGLDAAGCHRSKTAGYHCHPERGAARPAKAARAPQAGTAEERRLARECKGRPNAGACAGYAR